MANLFCRGNGDVKKAFTLAELLVSVLIISIVMVVLAPVITKRVTGENFTVSQVKNESKLFAPSIPDSLCHAISGVTNALECTFTVPQNVQKINAVLVSGGGGGAGATTPSYQYGKKETVTSSSKTISIISGMKNVKITYLIGSGGGGGGGAYKQEAGAAPTSQADCDRYNAKYLTASQNGGKAVCVTKYNIGDIPSATNGGIASSVTTVSTGSTCSANSCCWQGNTSGTKCDSSGTSYSGCNRTVCTWHAANASCLALAYNGTKAGDWRLPTKDELAKWKSNLSSINTNQGDNGLRLCDYGSGYGAARCNDSDVCYGSYSDNCYPLYVWSSPANGSYYYNYSLNYGTFYGPNYSNPRYAFSSAVSWRAELRPLTLSPAAEAAAPLLLQIT